jgi:hypothetical protein
VIRSEENRLIFLAFLVPLALYFLAISHLNRSPHPVLISGAWDFAGVLFAASGFLLVGGPAILMGLHDRWELAWARKHTPSLLNLGEHWYFWLSLWALYYVMVLAVAAYVLRRRRSQTSIYNVHASGFQDCLLEALDQLELEWQRGRTGRIFIRPREQVEAAEQVLAMTRSVSLPAAAALEKSAPAEVGSPVYLAAIDVEGMALMRHVTLHWHGETAWIRPQVEIKLAEALAEMPVADNPVAAWFFSFGISLLIVSCAGLVALVALNIIQRMH